MFDPDEVEKLSPLARVEVQEWVAKRWLMLHTEVLPRYGFKDSCEGKRDRRKCVRDTVSPREPWVRPWSTNLDPISAHFRRMRAAIPR